LVRPPVRSKTCRRGMLVLISWMRESARQTAGGTPALRGPGVAPVASEFIAISQCFHHTFIGLTDSGLTDEPKETSPCPARAILPPAHSRGGDAAQGRRVGLGCGRFRVHVGA